MFDSSWDSFLKPLRPHARVILWSALGCALAGYLIAFAVPKRYTARASMLPPSEDQVGLSMSSLLRGLTIPGVRVPLTVTPSDMVQSVLESDRLLGAVSRRVDIQRVYGQKDSLDAIEKLRKKARFKVTQLGVVEVRVEAPTAKDAANLANAFVTELDQFTRTQRMSRGHRTRTFIEKRLADIKVRLDSLQTSVANYQRTHHAAAPSVGLGSSLEASARMVAERMNLQFQLELARTYASENSEEVKSLETRLSTLDRQLDKLPPVGMELAAMMRDLKAHEQAYAFLTAQYEDARIEEARDVVTVEVLDPAVPPRKPSFPRKRLFAAGGLAVGLLTSIGWALAQDRRFPKPPA